MTSKGIEQEIQDKGSEAPRVTRQHIEDVIVSEHYFTGYDGIGGEGHGQNTSQHLTCFRAMNH